MSKYPAEYLVSLTFPSVLVLFQWAILYDMANQGILKGKYHCTIEHLFDWFGLVCFANKNKNCQLAYS